MSVVIYYVLKILYPMTVDGSVCDWLYQLLSFVEHMCISIHFFHCGLTKIPCTTWFAVVMVCQRIGGFNIHNMYFSIVFVALFHMFVVIGDLVVVISFTSYTNLLLPVACECITDNP